MTDAQLQTAGLLIDGIVKLVEELRNLHAAAKISTADIAAKVDDLQSGIAEDRKQEDAEMAAQKFDTGGAEP